MTEGKVAFCFPGQGSQEVGMGRAMSEAFPAARDVYERAAEATGFDVAALCFEGPIERLSETDVTQPALVTTELACLAGLTAAGLTARLRRRALRRRVRRPRGRRLDRRPHGGPPDA